MTVKRINTHTYAVINKGHKIIIRIKRDGKALMERWLDLDFRGLAS